MDKSLNTSLFSNKSPFSPRARQNLSTKRTAAQTSFRKSSRLSISGRSTQSVQFVLKSQQNSVERFGQPLPVQITEALTFADRNTVVSARISPECEYSWLVCGRRLLIWQYRQSPNQAQGATPRRTALSSQCYELQLPQSDLAHRAELVSVFMSSNTNSPSCIAVSPEGVVRYWPIIAHEGVSIEQLIDLHGQECDSLTYIEGLGSILATTTCTVVLVQPQNSSGRNLLTSRTLKTPSGWLEGLSRKMSSLIFGPNSSEQSAETRSVRVVAVPASEYEWTIYVLAGHSLQKWHISATESEQLHYVIDLTRIVRDGFNVTIWENCGRDHTDTNTKILDVQSDSGNLTLLAAAVNMHHSPQLHYAMVSIDTSTNIAPTQFMNFLLLKRSGLYMEDNPKDSLGYRLLLSGNSAYIFNHRCITVMKPNEEPDCLEFNSSHDFLLGGSIVFQTPVFFSRNHGLVAVTANELASDLNSSMMGPSASLESSFAEVCAENLSIYNFNPVEMCTAYKDLLGQFKAAFVFHVQKQISACMNILEQLFTFDGYMPGIDTILDKVVISVSRDLLNDIPANDPRWLGETQVGLGSSYAMQILQQLEDKQKGYNLYLMFLKETQLWNKLCAVTFRNTTLATVLVLAEYSEKIVAGIALKSSPYSDLLKRAIHKAIKDSDVDVESGLTKQDVFYRQISTVYKGIQEMVNNCDESVHSDLNPAEVATLINETNVIILKVFQDVFKYRQLHAESFTPNATTLSIAPDYLPWTSAAGSEGLMDSLLTMQNLTYTYGAKMTSDYTLRSTLYEQLVALIDFILDGRKGHLESIRGTANEAVLHKQYEMDRRRLINPLIQDNEWEGAAQLAEKYLDFESLVVICEKTNNESRLSEYMDRFSRENFSQFVYNWYMQENKQGKLMDQCRRLGNGTNKQQLHNFLQQHPSLLWIQKVQDQKFEEASQILISLAAHEKESVMREKTMLSLAKLAKLASGKRDEQIEAGINRNLFLITCQEELPDYLLQQFGYDTIKPPPIHPKDLICLFICPEYVDATEIEFKKALDLLTFIEDEELRHELRIKVWISAILKDNWDETDLDAPLDILQHKLFFKTADLSLVLGEDPSLVLPPLDVLMEAEDLKVLSENKTFQFLIKTGYEHVNNIANL